MRRLRHGNEHRQRRIRLVLLEDHMRTIIIVSLLVPTAAHAERRLELGVAVGGHAFSTNAELGVADHMTEPGPSSSGLLGLRFAVPFGARLAAQAEAGVLPAADDLLRGAAV